MAKLIYSAITSLDGYVADEDGSFDWAAPDEEVHAFVNDLERPVGTYLYGRRHVRGDGRLGDDGHRRRPAAVDARLRADLAGGRQGRVLADARVGVEREDADRARVRSRGGPADEGRRRSATSASAGPSWPARRSGPGWSTSATCSSPRSSSAAASGRSPTASAGELELLDERRFGNGVVYLHYRAA